MRIFESIPGTPCLAEVASDGPPPSATVPVYSGLVVEARMTEAVEEPHAGKCARASGDQRFIVIGRRCRSWSTVNGE